MFTFAGMRRSKGLRYAAIRKAQQAKQERDAKRLRRERQVESALAEYFEHVALVDAIETATATKVTHISELAAVAVEGERVAAAVALRAMLDLGETRTAVAELTGLTLTGVRDLLTAADPPAGADAPPPEAGSRADGQISTGTDSSFTHDDGEWNPAPYPTPAASSAPLDVAPDVLVPQAAGWSGSLDWARAPDRSGDEWST